MLILVKVIGILIAVMGIIILLSPKTMKQLINFFKVGKRLYWAGFLRLLFGVILLLSASQCRLVGVVIAMGILFLLAGVAIFAMGLERAKSIIDWWDKRSLAVVRLIALVPLALGALLIYSV